jgi:hypothetical protein
MAEEIVESATESLSARIPLIFAPGFSWRAVAAVMAEKFGLRGLRITAMIGVMVVYLWWRGCNGFMCMVLYVFAVAAILLAILVTWTAKESLDKFVATHQGNAFLLLDNEGVGGEATAGGELKTFKLPWDDFRRIVERHQFWLLETRQGGWMVLPTTHFSSDAWAIMRKVQRTRSTKTGTSKA